MKITVAPKPPSWLFPKLGDIRLAREYQWAKYAVIAQAVIGTLGIALFWRVLPPKVPLWYSKPWGEERLASPFLLILPLVTAVMIYFGNLILISKSATEHPMFARILLLSSVVVSMLAVMIVMRIVLLIG